MGSNHSVQRKLDKEHQWLGTLLPAGRAGARDTHPLHPQDPRGDVGGQGGDSDEGQSFASNAHQKEDVGPPLPPEGPELLNAPRDLLPRRWTHGSVTGPR